MTPLTDATREVLAIVLWEERRELQLARQRLHRATTYVPEPCKVEPYEDGVRRMRAIATLTSETSRLKKVTADLELLLVAPLPPGVAKVVAEDQCAELHLDVTDDVWTELARRARHDCKAVTA